MRFDELHDTCLKYLFLNYKTGTPVSFTNKTDQHNITEILFKVKHHQSIPPYNILLFLSVTREVRSRSNYLGVWYHDTSMYLVVHKGLTFCTRAPFDIFRRA